MKRFRLFAVVTAALTLMAAASVSNAETGIRLRRLPRVVSRPGMGDSVQAGQRVGQAVAAGYSVQLNIVTLAPMPSPSVSTATRAKAGLRTMSRQP